MRVKVENVTFGYGECNVLDGVSFEASSSMVTGIIGPNGSGKSTLIRVIGNVLKPSNGRVLLGDIDVSSLNVKRLARIIAAVPQDSYLQFSFTVRQMVLMGRSPYIRPFASERPEDYRIAEEAMDRTGVLHLADRSVMELSSGERQRVYIARALAQQPDILLLDEPTSHLDVNFQVEICSLIAHLAHEEGITVLVVLHDLNLASRYCDELVLFSSGHVASSGRPWDVITADNIKDVYNVDVVVDSNPTYNCPAVFPLGAVQGLKGTNM